MAVFEEVDEAEVESAGPVQGPTSDDEAERKADDASLDEPYEPEYDLVRAQEAKVVGNDRYAASEWQLASDAYTEAIMWAPPDAEERAVYYCNRAACSVKMGAHEAVVDDCAAALEIQPRYGKALVRRAQAYEALEKPTEALADAKVALEVDDTPAARALVARLEKKEADKLEREKEEMFGKLKDLGNMFLGNFGMSVDNFKATKDETTGSYNIAYEPTP